MQRHLAAHRPQHELLEPAEAPGSEHEEVAGAGRLGEHLRGRTLDDLEPDVGVVVNITSIAGVRPTGSSIPYAASKAALNHLTALLGNVCGPEVRVVAVAPGLIRTPWTADWGPLHDVVASTAPLGRSGEPEDVAEAVRGVIASRYLTGQVVVVDGGLTLR